ncbi:MULTISPECIES: glycosyltransferase [unclassified Chelatococcus]|uniref:glycosyltransferase n=1 Tax=unclassified Chelatococcus TaxID=2638111 RepID=UPI001BCEC099|nr:MULTISPECIES: glycosyltransferase [unclassified Chelatococcus]CAH1657994.1 Glycosyl transferase family 2 [Hyphomicrobiales bacterium]MBS7740750.1 glycosyltransferase [Chelatococcus sp. HY11]MBX3546016.1 glycosyltransferase [Chelatococcus sp.]MCO5079643.1 glycosyltransferase [Chelatococcus sp.]CAH1684270.1 Glycosyl transferase family 2 [Hyphomicrobiales bacterium]
MTTLGGVEVEASRTFHASIILNIHREAVFLKRTLLSLDEALAVAHDDGLAIELVAVFDRSDDATRAVLAGHDLNGYAHVEMLDVDNGSLGLSRNDGIARARGEFILTADADDLVSPNFLKETIRTARGAGPRCLVFPEYLFAFGATYHIWAYRDLATVTPFALIDMHPFTSRLCAHRDAFAELRYSDLRLSSGYAFEDWDLNCAAVAAGFDMRIAPGTLLFYRKRRGSLLDSAESASTCQIPPNPLFVPKTYLKICAPYYDRVAKAPGAVKPMDPPSRDLLARGDIRRAIDAANAIEPLISTPKYEHCDLISNSMQDLSAGVAYYKVCQAIGDADFTDVFLLPFMPRGGAEKYFLELLEAMYQNEPLSDTLLIFGENRAGPSWEDRVPPNASIVDFGSLCGGLPMDKRCLLTLKLIQSRTPDARIHLRDSVFTERFLTAFGPIMGQHECVYYHFCETELIQDGRKFIYYSPLNLIVENIDSLSKIICDSQAMIDRDRHRVGTQTEKWECLYAPVQRPAVIAPQTPEAQSRILWASRLDSEKRPDLLPLVAERLQRRLPNVHIHAFGGAVFNGFSATQLDGYKNLTFHGPYNGFESLSPNTYLALMYTSHYDGVPNTILEAMSHGLPVVASDVGGISEVVIDGKTGILLPALWDNDAMADAYVEALVRLHRDPALLQTFSQAALELVARQHSHAVYRARVAQLFGQRPRHASPFPTVAPKVLCHG